MEDQEVNKKRKNRLAVFEHVVHKEKTPKKRKSVRFSEDSSPSESELVIDDEEPVVRKKKKKSKPLIKLSEEPLSLKCMWLDCDRDDHFTSWAVFNAHIIQHASEYTDVFRCKWKDCTDELSNQILLEQHLCHHGYILKLNNIGENIVERDKLPRCLETHEYKIPVEASGYKCEWEFCQAVFFTLFEFFNHMPVHIKNNPKTATEDDEIVCHWNYCNTKYSTPTKLADHLRIHTKEKCVGCATCARLFSSKTKFSDHRKRQMSSALQCYQCSQCLKLFPTERLLRDHMRSHINHYKCTMCDMTCPKPSILAKHIRFKHISFKPYKCTECDKSFVEQCNLKAHMKTHEEENPLKCYLCNFSCRSKVGLDSHYVKKHDSAGLVYECHCCKKKFKRGTYLTKHLTKLHNYHWPSGHSRFKYRKDEDGVHRLQTVRYESLEVTQEMIRSESMQTNNVIEPSTYNLDYDNDAKSMTVLSTSKRGEHGRKKAEANNVILTIKDVDDEGNVVNCKVVKSKVVNASHVKHLKGVVPLQNAEESDDSSESTEIDVKCSANDDNNEITIKYEKVGFNEEVDGSSTSILDYKIFKHSKC
ncbi:histone H4 transcription factor-like [Diabrotica undecimpunctata]|uniref:histone H4 transcription factor-like n=1 Tax=Diabrotica undecimpunctata TaxID=50387 RepID=UPI003B63CA38